MFFNSELLALPSFYAHAINGILLLVAIILLFKNYSSIKNVDNYKIISLILLFSLAAGVHGLSHLGLERIYGYNPLQLTNR